MKLKNVLNIGLFFVISALSFSTAYADTQAKCTCYYQNQVTGTIYLNSVKNVPASTMSNDNYFAAVNCPAANVPGGGTAAYYSMRCTPITPIQFIEY